MYCCSSISSYNDLLRISFSIKTREKEMQQQPVISGRVQDTGCIITTVINKVPYYLTSDINSVPFFMQFKKGVTNGLVTFTNFALQLIVVLISGMAFPQISFQLASNKAYFVIQPTLHYISSPDPQAIRALIQIQNNEADGSLLAVGLSYIFVDPVRFLTLDDHIDNPNSIDITTLSTTSCSTFFITQIQSLVDIQGNPTTANVFPSIYNYNTQDAPIGSYFFTSKNDAIVGDYSPYTFCAQMTCGPSCYGACGGDYSECRREQSSGNFSCARTDDITACTWSIMTIMCVIYLLLGLGLGFLFFRHHPNLTKEPIFKKISEPEKTPTKVHEQLLAKIGDLSGSSSFIMGLLLVLYVVVPLIMFGILLFFPSVTRSIITNVCKL